MKLADGYIQCPLLPRYLFIYPVNVGFLMRDHRLEDILILGRSHTGNLSKSSQRSIDYGPECCKKIRPTVILVERNNSVNLITGILILHKTPSIFLQ